MTIKALLSPSDKARVYTSRLQKGGALLEDMRILVRNWTDEALRDEQRQKAILENSLGKRTRSRTAHVFGYAFSQRFLKGNPPGAWKLVRPLEDRDLPLGILKPVYYWVTARSDRSLYDFVVEEIHPKSKGHDPTVRLDETVPWIQRALSKEAHRWSDGVTLRVAQGMLAALRDFGILQGRAQKRIAPVYLPAESFSYIAFVLHMLGSSGEGLVLHTDWKLFLMEPFVVERLLLEAHQRGLLSYHAAGKIHRIEFKPHTLEEMADVIAGRAF